MAQAICSKSPRARSKSPRRSLPRLPSAGFDQDPALAKYAITRFLTNANYEILTKTSFSCVTLIATLKCEPFCFTNIRINDKRFKTPITSMLVKVMIKSNDPHKNKIEFDAGKEYEIQSDQSLLQEIVVHHDIFNKSSGVTPIQHVTKEIQDEFPSMLDGICPQLLWSAVVSDKNREIYQTAILESFSSKPDIRAINFFFRKEFQVDDSMYGSRHIITCRPVFICMELLDGYKPFTFYRPKTIKEVGFDGQTLLDDLSEAIAYELIRLMLCGYTHSDLHDGNIMFHPEIPDYYGKGRNGRLQLIDFGRVYQLKPVPPGKKWSVMVNIDRPKPTFPEYMPTTLDEFFIAVSGLSIFTSHRIRYPKRSLLDKIITHRKEKFIEDSMKLLLYGEVYQSDMIACGKNPSHIKDISDFIQSNYIQVIHKNHKSVFGTKK